MPSKSRQQSRQQRRKQQRQDRGQTPPTSKSNAPPADAQPTSHGQQLLVQLLAPVLIVIIGLAAFANSFQGEFLFDDLPNITKKQAFFSDDAVESIWKRSDRPLTDFTFLWNIRHQGVDDGSKLNPVPFHIVNITIHLIAALALFGIVRRSLLLPVFIGRFRHSALWIALITASIWVVHPLQTQGVTYIVQRAESLMAMFYLLTLYCYIRGATAMSPWRWYWLAGSVLACFAGMASKPIMVTAPVVIVLYDLCLLTLPQKKLPSVPRLIALLSIASSWSVLLFTRTFSSILDPSRDGTVGLSYRHAETGDNTWWFYLLTQSEVILHYLRLSVWPSPLILDYQWPLANSIGDVALPLVVIILLGLLTLWALIRRPGFGFVAACFFIILAPTSSVIPIIDVAFEHRMYLPLAAVVTLVVVSVALVLPRLWSRLHVPPHVRTAIIAAVAIGVIGALAVATHQRNRDYHDAERMWQSVLARNRQPRALNNLAARLVWRSEEADTSPEQKLELHNQACELFQEMVDLNPDPQLVPLAVAYYNLGKCADREGNLDLAIEHFRTAIQYNPRQLEAYIEWGNALSKQRDHEGAAERFRAAIEAGGKMRKAEQRLLVARASFNLGNEMWRLNRWDEAIDAYTFAADTWPARYLTAYMQVGQAYEFSNRPQRAAEAYEYLLKRIPDHTEARRRLNRLQSLQSAGG